MLLSLHLARRNYIQRNCLGFKLQRLCTDTVARIYNDIRGVTGSAGPVS